jgi:hypothetical protein
MARDMPVLLRIRTRGRTHQRDRNKRRNRQSDRHHGCSLPFLS